MSDAHPTPEQRARALVTSERGEFGIAVRVGEHPASAVLSPNRADVPDAWRAAIAREIAAAVADRDAVFIATLDAGAAKLELAARGQGWTAAEANRHAARVLLALADELRALAAEGGRMSAGFVIVPVQSTGSHKSIAFVDGVRPNGQRFGELRELDVEEFPPSPMGERLNELRLRLDCSLREAAQILGLRAVQVSDLERGRATLESDEEWELLFRMLAQPVTP